MQVQADKNYKVTAVSRREKGCIRGHHFWSDGGSTKIITGETLLKVKRDRRIVVATFEPTEEPLTPIEIEHRGIPVDLEKALRGPKVQQHSPEVASLQSQLSELRGILNMVLGDKITEMLKASKAAAAPAEPTVAEAAEANAEARGTGNKSQRATGQR